MTNFDIIVDNVKNGYYNLNYNYVNIVKQLCFETKNVIIDSDKFFNDIEFLKQKIGNIETDDWVRDFLKCFSKRIFNCNPRIYWHVSSVYHHEVTISNHP